MATIPVPRSYAQALGDLLDVFLSRLGFRGLKVGGPLLSIFESAAQSDVRSSSDIFSLLAAITLTNAKGDALDRIGADEGVVRIASIRANTTVSLLDASFTKVASRIYQGKPAPVAGSSVVYVVDGSQFPVNGGSVYVGRDTANLEGPLAYTNVTKSPDGSYYTITLSGTTTKFHNLAESVTLAQGGDRVIRSGQTIQTTPNGSSPAVSFSTIETVTMLDGETELDGVRVVAQQAGVSGNVPADSLVNLSPTPFTGAAVTNPLPVSNGYAVEQDDAFRERIRAVRASRSKGTPLAVQTGVLGLAASDDSSRIVSAKVVMSQGEPTTLYIDDGTGYEEKTAAVAMETVVAQAVGGEQRLALTGGRPVTKAFVATTSVAPFPLVGGCVLAVKVGGILSQIAFTDSQFRDVANATAFECVAAINSTYSLPFAARTIDGGQGFAIFAKADSNEDVQVVAPATGTDANSFFGFSTTRVDTVRLFKNDALLYKDGLDAAIYTTDYTTWSPNTQAGDTFIYTVDGTAKQTITFQNADFVNAGTGYAIVSASNSLAAWAAVFNYKCPGITATVTGNQLRLVSNLGKNSRASLVIDAASTLITDTIFNPTTLTATGRSSDYTFDRNLAQIKLATPLTAGDVLTAATAATRAYIQSSSFSTITVPAASSANLWFVVDGAASIVPTGVTAQTGLTVSTVAISASDNLVSFNAAAGTFSNAKPGDWLIVWDPALTTPHPSVAGTWRLADVGATGASVTFEADFSLTDAVSRFATSGGFVVVRSAAAPQKVSIAAGIQSPDSIATSMNAQLVGATASVFQTSRLRVATDTYGLNGQIALVTADTNAQLISLAAGVVGNQSSHTAFVEAGNPEIGTPLFDFVTVNVPTGASFTVSDASISSAVNRGQRGVWLRPLPTAAAPHRDQSNRGTSPSALLSVSGTTMQVQNAPSHITTNARLYSASHYAMAPDDTLNVVLDGDLFSKNYLVPLARTVKPASGGTWTGTQVSVSDSDGTTLANAFGTAFDFSDFRLFLRARAITNPPVDQPADATTNAVLWRANRYGPGGERYRVSYTNPTAPSQGFAVTGAPGDFLDVFVRLPSGAARAVTLGQKFAVASSDAGQVRTVTYFSGVRGTTTPSGANSFTVTMTGMPANVTDHQMQVGDVVMIWGGTNCPAGLANVTARTATTVTVQYQGALTTSAGAIEGLNVTETVGSTPTVPLSLSAVVLGDIASVSAQSKLAAAAALNGRVYAVDANGQWFQIQVPIVGGALNAGYAEIIASTNLQFFPIDTSLTNTAGAANLATRVNALNNPYVTAAIPAYALNGVPKSGQPVTLSTWDDFVLNGKPQFGYQMATGSKHVSASSYAAPYYTLTINATGAGSGNVNWITDGDWANEDAKLVPVAARSLARYFNQPSITGFATTGEVKATTRAGKLQIATGEFGSAGSVRVLGGTANSVTAPVVGYALPTTSGCVVQIKTSDAAGLYGNAMVAVQGVTALPKTLDWTTATTLALSAAGGNTTTMAIGGAGTLAKYAGGLTAAYSAKLWRFEQHGRFTCMVYADAGVPADWSGVKEGDWVRIQRGTGTVSAANSGLFRVVRVNYTKRAVWFENANVVEEDQTVGTIEFYTADSILPGDQAVINSTALGAANVGVWTVSDLGAPVAGVVSSITINGAMTPVAATALGANVSLVQVIPSTPVRLIKRISYLAQDTANGAYTNVAFTSQDSYSRINSSAGCYITPLDKLGFATTQVTGLDAYQYSTGLIGEANRVVYGVTSDADTYPGIVAAGAKLNISGPLVRRISVGLSIRVQQGLDSKKVVARVQSAVATVVNQSGVGQAVDLSALVRAARNVQGVTSVAVTSPAYGIGADLIAVQPYEKPMVLNLDADVLVSIAGT